MEEIAIVILNWNGISYLEKFLPGVIENANGARVILADNASSDDSVEFVRSRFPSVEIIRNSENGGFARGYNEALRQVDSEFYLLLNSDIEVTPGWLEPLYEAIRSDASIAGCQPKVRAFHDRSRFEHAGACGGFMDSNYYPFCRGRIFMVNEEDHGQYDSQTEIFWATGAALLIRAELFHRAGGFDEAFFAHMEEIDLCWRIKRLGYRFLVVPKSVIFHVGGGTLSYESPRKSFLNFRNSLYMIIKNHRGILFGKLFNRMLLDGIAGARFLMRGEFRNLYMVLKAHLHMYRRLPILLRQRKELKRLENRPNLSGLYRGSIVWAHFFKKIDYFNQLNQRLFK